MADHKWLGTRENICIYMHTWNLELPKCGISLYLVPQWILSLAEHRKPNDCICSTNHPLRFQPRSSALLQTFKDLRYVMVLIHTSKFTNFLLSGTRYDTYGGVSVVDEVLQIEEGGIRVWFEILQEEGWLQLLTLLSLQTVREDLHGHLLVMVQSPLGILQHHFNDATPGAMGGGGWTRPDLEDFISYSLSNSSPSRLTHSLSYSHCGVHWAPLLYLLFFIVQYKITAMMD